MCRKPIGVREGFVCSQHEGRCIICDVQFDEITPTMRRAYLCDDCGTVSAETATCLMCNAPIPTEYAYYCQYCVALEKDRDGCPRVLNQSRQQKFAALRSGLTQ